MSGSSGRFRVVTILIAVLLLAGCLGDRGPRYGLQYNRTYFPDFEPLVGQQPGIASWSSDPNVNGFGGFFDLTQGNWLLGGRARYGRHSLTQTYQPGLGYPDVANGTVDGWFFEPYAGWTSPLNPRVNLGLQSGPVLTLDRANYNWSLGDELVTGSRTHTGLSWQFGSFIDVGLWQDWGLRGGINWTNSFQKDADNNRNVYLGFTYTKTMIARNTPPGQPLGGTQPRPPQPPAGGTATPPRTDSTPPIPTPPTSPPSTPPRPPPSTPPNPPGPPPVSRPPQPPIPTPPRDPPSTPPDSQPDPSCCGFRGLDIFYPRLTDARKPPAIQAAPRATAMLASTVLVPNGAFFHQAQDLGVEGVGFPFDWTRHYVSDFETETGGMIGHRWDFTLDKRILPLGGTVAGEGLMKETPGVQKASLMYFNGQGRAEVYTERISGRRDNILNFARIFSAHVTAYNSPPGAFHEIERYVLYNPEEHPFARHPNVEPGEAIFFVLREKNGLRYVFNCRGQLIHILSRHDFTSYGVVRTDAGLDSVRLTVVYGGNLNPTTQSQMPQTVHDASGNVYNIQTVEIGQGQLDTNFECRPIRGPQPILRIARLTGVGTTVDYSYAPGSTEAILESVRITTGSIRNTTKYAYDNRHRLLRMTPPNEVARAPNDSATLANTYDGQGRVTNQVLGGGLLTWRIAYNGTTQATATNAAGDAFELQLRKIGPYYVTGSETIRSGGSQPGGPWVTRYEHNEATQVTSLTHPRGNVVRYEYDTDNAPVTLGTIRDFNGGVTYDNDLTLGNLLAVVNDPGAIDRNEEPQRTSYTYEALFNQLASETDARGSTTRFTFAYNNKGEFGNPLRVEGVELTQPDGAKLRLAPVRYTYNTKGQVETIVDRRGGMTTFTYDGPSWFLKQVDYPGRGVRTYVTDRRGYVLEEGGSFGRTRFDRDDRGRVTTRETFTGQGFSSRVHYEYDLHNQVTQTRTEITDHFSPGDTRLPDGQTIRLPDAGPTEVIATMEYDRLGRTVREVTGGIERRYEYDRRGGVSATVTPSPTGTGTLRTDFESNARGLVTRRTPGLEGAAFTTFDYDLNTNLTRRQEGPDTTRRMTWRYDAFDRLLVQVDGRTTRLERRYDISGNVRSEVVTGTRGNGLSAGKLAESEYEYNELNLLTRTKSHLLDRAGTILEGQAFYTTAGDVDRMIDGGRNEKRFKYDAAGRTIEVAGADVTTQTQYTPAGYPAVVTEIETEFTWNPATRRATPRQVSRSTGFTYDEAGRVIQKGGVGPEIRYFYNSQGQVRAQYEAGHGVTSTDYDVLGQTVAIARGGAFERFQYRPSGHVWRQETQGTAKVFTYDALGRVIIAQDEKAARLSLFDWNQAGDMIQSRDANGTIIRYTHDAMGAVTRAQITLGSNTFNDLGQQRPTLVGPTWEEFEYDGLGRPLRAATSDRVSTTMEYDGFSRMVAEVQERDGVRHRIERRYAPDDRWSELTYPQSLGGTVVRHDRSITGQVDRVSLGGRAVVDFTYNGPDRVATRRFANGAVGAYTYDMDRRITGVDVSGPSGQPGQFRTWWGSNAQYRDERLARLVERRNTRAGVLTTESTSDYQYDVAGRRTSTTTTQRQPVAGGTDQVHATSTHTQYTGGRAAAIAEFAHDGARVVMARHDAFVHDIALRVTSSTNSARLSFPASMRPAVLTDVASIATAVRQSPTATERQRFEYDKVGNLIADSTYIYAYDHANRLKLVTERSPRGSKESIFFIYDALGRRVYMTPNRERAPLGFAQWAPWARQSVAFVYDGQDMIGELEGGNTMLARYVIGAGPGDRVRMDRRRNDDVAAPLVTWYLHESAQGAVALASDSSGTPHWIGYAPASGATPFRAPNDLHTISGTQTRSPYISGSTRVDGFAGIRYNERTGTEVNDFRDNRALSDRADMYQMTQQMQAFTATTLTVMAAMAAGGIGVAALPSAGVLLNVTAAEGFKYMMIGGALSVGGGYLGASWQGTEYTWGAAAADFGEGMILGLVGGAMAKAGAGLAEIAAVDFATGFWSGFGRSLATGSSIADAATQGATTGAFGAGLGLGIGTLGRAARGEQVALSDWVAARRASRSVPRVASTETLGALNGRWQTAVGEIVDVQGNVLDAAYLTRAPSRKELALERSILRYLQDGTAASRHIARLIRSGELRVRFSDEPAARFYGRFEHGTDYITINMAASRGERTNLARELAATVTHEGVHYLGGGELSAWWAHAKFLMRTPGKHSAVPGVRYLSRNFSPDSRADMGAARKGIAGIGETVERLYTPHRRFVGFQLGQVATLKSRSEFVEELVGLRGTAEQQFVKGWLLKHNMIWFDKQLSIP